MGMGKKATNFKEDTLKLIKQLLTELVLAASLGTLPIYLFSKSSETLDEMISGLLAIGPLIDYYAWMLALYAFLIIMKYVVRFGSDQGKTTFNFIHKIVTEVGTGFQTILRTGSGVAVGVLLLSKAVTTNTTSDYSMLCWMAVVPLFLSCIITMFSDEVMQRTERKSYKNTLKLDIKRTKN